MRVLLPTAAPSFETLLSGDPEQNSFIQHGLRQAEGSPTIRGPGLFVFAFLGFQVSEIQVVPRLGPKVHKQDLVWSPWSLWLFVGPSRRKTEGLEDRTAVTPAGSALEVSEQVRLLDAKPYLDDQLA